MTALNINNIPANVTTVEKLIVWAGSILDRVNPDETFIEAAGRAELVVQTGAYKLFINGSTDFRHIIRVAIPLGGGYLEGVDPWEDAQEISTAPIPAGFVS